MKNIVEYAGEEGLGSDNVTVKTKTTPQVTASYDMWQATVPSPKPKPDAGKQEKQA